MPEGNVFHKQFMPGAFKPTGKALPFRTCIYGTVPAYGIERREAHVCLRD